MAAYSSRVVPVPERQSALWVSPARVVPERQSELRNHITPK